ncbi:DUF397 domain-containing protein [Kitasatospora sp. NPDC101155]|uniref:DUF397 domain-containing protein n=1 Tax=Kitasatospora sp. NPDC101155 TaxID=3364097 RepID=UPI00381E8F58
MRLHDQTADWFKSSYSSQQGDNCVEALRLSSGIAIRDSKDKSGPNLQFTAEAWQSLVAGIKAGELG